MARYFSFSVIAAACQELRATSVRATDLSALRYCLAFDAFVKRFGRDCSPRKNLQDKNAFIELVGDVVALDACDEGDLPTYIDNFEGKKPAKSELAQQISSNFITANAVRQSRGKSNEPYPSGANKYLFKASDEVLVASSINYGHIRRYLQTPRKKAAFAVWLLRFDELPEYGTLIDAIRTSLERRYSSKMVDALLEGVQDSASLCGISENDMFGTSRPHVDWAQLYPVASYPDDIDDPYNWIFFGAPGTGKSYQLKKLAERSFIEENISRVTFYPDYTYSQFVGSFKPITKYQHMSDSEKSAKERESKVADDDASAPQNEAGEHMEAYISYEFVPGPFLDVYIKAVQNPDENFLLVVEEINRANPAAVFGDVFQLLDRDASGRSVYEVAVPREMHDYLRIFLPEYATNAHITNPNELLSEQERLKNEASRLSLPGNMYIWATMNSADQGVFPMDTAFKRRWDFRYMDINEGEDAVIDGTPLNKITVPCGGHNIPWNNLRHAINEFMMSDYLKINEDKLLGPFFINPQVLVHTPERFGEVFKDKVLLYLYEDAGKTKHPKMFKKELNTYSKICKEFDKRGADIFGEGFNSSGLADATDDADANPVEV